MAEHAHTREAIRQRLSQARRPNYLRDWVYGGVDGAVTTFAVVSGVAGAQLSSRVVIIMGWRICSPTASRWRPATTAEPRPRSMIAGA